ncbi:hypothetical protein V1520DRAFT_341513 [Lipomyces starkeyi]|uniref:Uncharacterized protein n=1 Tax=Lipomyces starkeyi NRRL Y-11557 TaxID=675824 RepID=A0A1E3Q1T0_LIPST|nr:hypothetical protein LIPSTDRAFT_73335 [Lipomyces starkeyi NRRL Y-11557]
MPVTRSASANVVSVHAAVPTPIEQVTPKSKGRSRRAVAVKRTSLIENPSIGNISQPRMIVPEHNSACGDSETPLNQKVLGAPIIDIMICNAPQDIERRSYDKDCGSDDSFEKSILWSAKNAKQRRKGAPIHTQARPPKAGDTKITYSPVLANILAKGLDSAELQPIGSEKSVHPALNYKFPTTATTTAQCSQSEASATDASLLQSTKSAIRQHDSIPSEGIASVNVKDVKKVKPSTTNTNNPSNITKQLRQRHKADIGMRQQENAPENKVLAAVASVTRKPSFRSPRKPTETVPFSFATDARAKSERKASATQSQSSLRVDSASIVSTSAPTRPTLQKKRSALLEREKVVKKSLSNLSLRSQYSGKLDMNDYSNKPQQSSRNISAPTATHPTENTADLPGPTPMSSTASLRTAGKSVRKSLFTSLSFYRSKSDLKKIARESIAADTKRETVSVIPSYANSTVIDESSAAEQLTSDQNPLAGGIEALNLAEPTQETINRQHQITKLEKLRQASSEEGRRTVELWAARQQQRASLAR